MPRLTTLNHYVVVFTRLLGLGAAATNILLWCIFLFANPYSRASISTGTYVVAALMIILALLAIWGTLSLKWWALVLTFVGSFVPIGLYTLGLPGIFRFVGYASMLYLFVGVLLFVTRKSTRL